MIPKNIAYILSRNLHKSDFNFKFFKEGKIDHTWLGVDYKI